MLTGWHAVRLENRMASGRTKPLLIDCRLNSGTGESLTRARFVVKALGLPEIGVISLCHEAIGHLVAQRCGAVGPLVGLVEIPASLLEQNSHTLRQWGLSPVPGVAVGCEHIEGLTPMLRQPKLTVDELPGAAVVYAVDMLLQNTDRRCINPNCAFDREGRITVFDFESSFSFRYDILKLAKAWEVSAFGFHKEHVFYKVLRGHSIDWNPFISRLAQLTDDECRSWVDALPMDWRLECEVVLDHLKTVRENAGLFEDELRKSLA